MIRLTEATRARLRELDREKRSALAPAKLADKIRRRAEKKAAPKFVPVEGQRAPRVREPLYLAWLRRLPCVFGSVAGGCEGPTEAAHVRMSSAKHGKFNPGMQSRPDDVWCLPSCKKHHAQQHAGSEAKHWQSVNIDPFALCIELHAAFLEGRDGAAIIEGVGE